MNQDSFSFSFAKERAQALGEIHARPAALLSSPRVIFQLAFLTENHREADQELVAELARTYGVAAPDGDTSHFVMNWPQGQFRWERHTEFSTYFWDAPAPDKFGGPTSSQPFVASFTAPVR